MALPLGKLGLVYEADAVTIDKDRSIAYALATNDLNPLYLSGQFAPPVFGVVPTWEVLTSAMEDLVPKEAILMVVHGEQDMHFKQPLVPGKSLKTVAVPYCYRVGNSGTRATIKMTSYDGQDGAVVLVQYVTVFIRGMTDGSSGGPDKPDHDFPEEARSKPIGSGVMHVDVDQTFRYRDASGDNMPIHLDDAVAKSVGLPGIIAHGLCSLAMASHTILEVVADRDPVRLKRLAGRFAKPVFPGNDLITNIYDVGRCNDGHAWAFEVYSRGDLVISNGRAETAP